MRKLLLLLIMSSLVFSQCKQPDSLTIKLEKAECDLPGRRVPDGEIPTPRDVALDVFCARVITKRSAPNGFITIFGSARAKEGMISYDMTREFALLWTKAHGKQHPILTGGGPGIMEAGNRGAKEANGTSLGFSTYFGKGNEPLNSYTTDGYVFASFSQREADMVDHAAAIVIAPGGVGTSWEIYETLSKIQTNKKKRVPVILLGSEMMWHSLFAHIAALKAMKTISADDDQLLQRAGSAAEAVLMIQEALKFDVDTKSKDAA